MGRPKLYANNAEKQAAYRASKNAETVPVDRAYHEWLFARLFQLRDAVNRATEAGDAVAATIDTVSPDDVILSLIKHFEGQAVAMGPPAVAPMASAAVVPSAEVASSVADRPADASHPAPAPASKGQKRLKKMPRR